MNQFQSIVRLFPLPNVVLFPRAILPLHIFEERYKQMVADALSGDGKIAMALLKPGQMRDNGGCFQIEPVVCIGRIISCEQLSDGKYNLLLQGTERAVIDREINGKLYRQARVSPLAQTAVEEIDLSCERWRLQELFLQAETGTFGKQYAELLTSELKTPEIADLLAYHLLENIELKQSLLAEADVALRVRRIVDYLQSTIPMMRQASDAAGAAMN